MKQKACDQWLVNHVIDLLSSWSDVQPRRMFSGVGLFAFGRMFAIIFDDVLYLKDTKDKSGKPVKEEFEKEYFGYRRQGKFVQLGYFKVPEEALDDGDFLIRLATKSFQNATQKKPAKSAR